MATKTLGILDQVRNARGNKLALALAVPPAAFLPIAVFVIAHSEIPADIAAGIWWKAGLKGAFALGGLLFSAKSVFGWAAQMFEDKAKAVGFVALLEGVMVLSETTALSHVALVLLVGINAVAAASSVAMNDSRTKARKSAARRAAKTRAGNSSTSGTRLKAVG